MRPPSGRSIPFLASVTTFGALLACGSPTAPTALTLSQQTVTAALHTTVQLTAQARDGAVSDVTAAASWSTSNPSVATVSGGLVSIVGLGTAQVSATYHGASIAATVTGRRRTHFDAEFLVRDVEGDNSVYGFAILLDGRQLIIAGGSGPGSYFSLSVRGSGPDKPIEPGHHEVAIQAELTSGTHQLAVGSTNLTIYDSDTGEALTTIPLAGQRGNRTNPGTFTWSFEVPTYTQ